MLPHSPQYQEHGKMKSASPWQEVKRHKSISLANSPDAIKSIQNLGQTPEPTPPEEFDRQIRAEYAR
jgi:hypothetical protein